MKKAKAERTIILCKTETGKALQAQGFNVLARKVERGTRTAEQAKALVNRINRETGKDACGVYAGKMAVHSATMALHQIENFSGGQEYISNLAMQSEKLSARMMDRETKQGAVIPGTEFQHLFNTDESMPDVMDTVQECALAICEHGFLANDKNTQGQASENPVHTAKNGHVRTDTYSWSHRAAIDGANRFINSQAKRAKKWIQSKDDIIADDKAKLLASIGAKEQSYTVEIDSEALKVVLSFCRTQWERDVVQAFIDCPVSDATAQPTKKEVYAHMVRRKDSYRESTQRILAMTEKTCIQHITGALKSIATADTAPTVRQALIEALYSKRDGKAYRIHA